MRTTKVDPDLVDITQYNKFGLELFWGLERILLGTSIVMGGQVFWGMGVILLHPQSESMGGVSLWSRGMGGILVSLQLSRSP